MNTAAADIFTRSLEEIRLSTSVPQIRRVAARAAAELRALDRTNGVVLHCLLRENRDARIQHLRAAEAAATEPGPADFSRLARAGLTRREAEVLGWVAQGKRDAEIAAILGISKKTVSKHVEHLLAKLGAETRTAAVSAAQEQLRRLPA
jgi:DNA-binding CsgD family transcriptional regulator